MERQHFRATSLFDIQAELRERELLREARARWRAPQRDPESGTGLPGLTVLRRRFLG